MARREVVEKLKKIVRDVISTEVEVDPRLLEAIRKREEERRKKAVPASP